MNNYRAKLNFLFFQESISTKLLKIFFQDESEEIFNPLLLNKQAIFFR